jgi:hypothetical protein
VKHLGAALASDAGTILPYDNGYRNRAMHKNDRDPRSLLGAACACKNYAVNSFTSSS